MCRMRRPGLRRAYNLARLPDAACSRHSQPPGALHARGPLPLPTPSLPVPVEFDWCVGATRPERAKSVCALIALDAIPHRAALHGDALD
jgi:hypothetical protein